MMESNCFWKPISRSLSASSRISTSKALKDKVLQRERTSAMRPGVPTSTPAPLDLIPLTSVDTSVPPMSGSSPHCSLHCVKNGCATACVCRASSRVGDTMMATTCSNSPKQFILCAGSDRLIDRLRGFSHACNNAVSVPGAAVTHLRQ